MINQHIISMCREFIARKEFQRSEITMNLKMSLGRDNRFEEIGYRLGQLKPFIDYIYDDIFRLYETQAEFYTHCNISRQVFSNMQTNDYDPTKQTIYKILIGLKLEFLDAVVLMENAGYTFTFKTREQLIVIFCLLHRFFDTEDVDALLVEFGEEPLFSTL